MPRSVISSLPDTGPGFFGKLTSHGDFVARRVPFAFRQTWDGWLQAGLQASRAQLGADWLATYLTSPIWRFVVARGVCDQNAWAGVMIPNVDRVGRYFPLTLVASMADAGSMLDWIDESKDWFDQLESLALSTLDPAFVFDAFDAALRAVPALSGAIRGRVRGLPAAEEAAPHAHGIAWLIKDWEHFHEQARRLLPYANDSGHSLWWTTGSSQVSPCGLICRHLPTPISFTGMLNGDWAQCGWQVKSMSINPDTE